MRLLTLKSAPLNSESSAEAFSRRLIVDRHLSTAVGLDDGNRNVAVERDGDVSRSDVARGRTMRVSSRRDDFARQLPLEFHGVFSGVRPL
jgi:hypothetical protein